MEIGFVKAVMSMPRALAALWREGVDHWLCRRGRCAMDVVAVKAVMTSTRGVVEVWNVEACRLCGKGRVSVSILGDMQSGPVASADVADAAAAEAAVRECRAKRSGEDISL